MWTVEVWFELLMTVMFLYIVSWWWKPVSLFGFLVNVQMEYGMELLRLCNASWVGFDALLHGLGFFAICWLSVVSVRGTFFEVPSLQVLCKVETFYRRVLHKYKRNHLLKMLFWLFASAFCWIGYHCSISTFLIGILSYFIYWILGYACGSLVLGLTDGSMSSK